MAAAAGAAWPRAGRGRWAGAAGAAGGARVGPRRHALLPAAAAAVLAGLAALAARPGGRGAGGRGFSGAPPRGPARAGAAGRPAADGRLAAARRAAYGGGRRGGEREWDRGERDQGWEEWDGVEGVQPDDISYSTVIHACAQKQDPRRAERWLEKMEEGHASGAAPPSAFCYNAVVQAWTRARGGSARAAHWLDAARRAGVEVAAASRRAAAAALVREGALQEAERVARDMLADGVPMPPASAGGLLSIAAAWGQRGDHGRAAALRELAAKAPPEHEQQPAAAAARPWPRRAAAGAPAR